MKRIFEEARRVSAAEIARNAGVQLKRSGNHEWACCPLHGEKTASMCFYPDGGWYCFGCGNGGDAVDLYSMLHGCNRLEAAKAITGSTMTKAAPVKAQRKKKPDYLAGADDDGYTWDKLCEIRSAACAIIDEENGDTDRLWDAIAARSMAEERMDNLLLDEMDNMLMDERWL